MALFIQWLCQLFQKRRPRRTKASILVLYNGSLKVTLPDYTRKRLRMLYKMEHRLAVEGIGTNVEIIPFETFFTTTFPEAADLPFHEQKDLWKYYHRTSFDIVRKKQFHSLTINLGLYYTAIDVALILSHAEKWVMINHTCSSEEFLSFTICKRELSFAKTVKLVCVHVINGRVDDHYGIRNDKGMYCEQINSFDHFVQVSLTPS